MMGSLKKAPCGDLSVMYCQDLVEIVRYSVNFAASTSLISRYNEALAPD